jgi:hypothetical protein
VGREPPTDLVEPIDPWRSNCPRHSVWDDAFVDGLVRVVRGEGPASRPAVTLTVRGRAALDGRP